MIKIKSGIGYDIHRLTDGNALYIGGISVSDKHRFVAHSDGDVLIHALIDGITGALGIGDIGEIFPNTDPKYKDYPSSKMLTHVITLMQERNFEIVNIDCIVISEFIKISPHKKEIISNLTRLMRIPLSSLNVKGKTKERNDDSVGKGEAIECFCSVMIRYVEKNEQ